MVGPTLADAVGQDRSRAIAAVAVMTGSTVAIDPRRPDSPSPAEIYRQCLESDPYFVTGDVDLAMKVDFSAIANIGSERDCRFFSSIAALQSAAMRALPTMHPEAIEAEVAAASADDLLFWHYRLLALAQSIEAPSRRWMQ